MPIDDTLAGIATSLPKWSNIRSGVGGCGTRIASPKKSSGIGSAARFCQSLFSAAGVGIVQLRRREALDLRDGCGAGSGALSSRTRAASGAKPRLRMFEEAATAEMDVVQAQARNLWRAVPSAWKDDGKRLKC